MNRRGFISFLLSAPVTKVLPWGGIAKLIEPIAPKTAATITGTLDEIISVTIRARTAELIANIEANNALMKRLYRK